MGCGALLSWQSPVAAYWVTLPPWAVQLATSVVSVQPWPLQEFWPLHADEAVLQALVPLHELIPLHFIVSPALAVDVAVPIANRAAAEATRRARLVMANS